MSQDANPVLVEIRRGELVESRHRGAIAIVDSAGAIVAAWGDIGRPTFPRSAIKPVQAMPLVETGALDAFGLGSEELALASASHSGEPRHVEKIAAWLARIGLSAQDLECGAPVSLTAISLTAMHNNCSGKHAGFLTIARHLGFDPKGYVRPDHPVQRLVSDAIARTSGVADAPFAVDGCSIPTFALPLKALALAMTRVPRRIVEAMLAHPELVAGSGRLDTKFMGVVNRIAIKGGAEGCYAAMIPDQGWGVAVKIDDGAGRASEVAMLAALDRMGCLGANERAALADSLNPVLRNVAGLAVGEIRPSACVTTSPFETLRSSG